MEPGFLRRAGGKIESQELAALITKAKEVLNRNWLGASTKPSPHLYPHQWNWDSGFIAIGYARYDQRRAQRDGGCFSIPNYDLAGDYLDTTNYWRGPVWINTNWLLMQGVIHRCRNGGAGRESRVIKRLGARMPILFF